MLLKMPCAAHSIRHTRNDDRDPKWIPAFALATRTGIDYARIHSTVLWTKWYLYRLQLHGDQS